MTTPDEKTLATLTKLFEEEFGPIGDRQVLYVHAPGRSEISGNHTDHEGGHVIAGSLDVAVDGIAVATDSNKVRVADEGYPTFEIVLDTLNVQESEKGTSASLVRGMAHEVAALGVEPQGFDFAFTCSVPSGGGLSSSAAFEMGMAAIWNGEYGCGLAPAELAKICQYAENTYFGKPSGLLDQLTSAVGGIIFADFADPQQPVLEKIHADGLLPPGMSLCVTDTRDSHSELTGEFAAIRQEMEQIAAFLGKKVLGQVTESAFWAALPALRKACGDRAVLRAIHYFEENARTLAQRDALQAGQFAAFAALVLESGRASFALCQNVYCSTDVRHQGLSVALALSQSILQGSPGAWRMQGGGFAGTIQAYVPQSLLERYHSEIERVFGKGSCYILRLREQGAVKVI